MTDLPTPARCRLCHISALAEYMHVRNLQIAGRRPFDTLEGLIDFAAEPVWLTRTGSSPRPVPYTLQQEQSCTTVMFRVAGVPDTKGAKTRRLRQGGAEHVLQVTEDRNVTAKHLGHAASGTATDRSYQFQLLHSLEDLIQLATLLSGDVVAAHHKGAYLRTLLHCKRL